MCTACEVPPAEAVQRGVALLDEKRPDWWKEVDPDRLSMGSPWSCTLGQLYGSYGTGLKELELLGAFGRSLGVKYGFYAMSFEDYDELTRLWRLEINSRLNIKSIEPITVPQPVNDLPEVEAGHLVLL